MDPINTTTITQGIVYIFTNPAMPDLLKIGFTGNEDIKVRMGQLYNNPVVQVCYNLAKEEFLQGYPYSATFS